MAEAENYRPVAVITGASSGLGAEFARALAVRGFDLLLVARRRDRLQELARQFETNHAIRAVPLVADLSLDDGVASVAHYVSTERRLELLVNNAGFGAAGYFAKVDLEVSDRMHRLHVMATLRLTHAALKAMSGRDRGGIINVSSVAAFAHMPGASSYCATKAWMNAFTECIHMELKSSGSKVRIQALCPGYTYTEFHDTAGIDRKRVMPSRKFWMTAEFVVTQSLRTLGKGDWLVVPGWRYRIIVSLLKIMPGFLVQPIALAAGRRRKRGAQSGVNPPRNRHV